MKEINATWEVHKCILKERRSCRLPPVTSGSGWMSMSLVHLVLVLVLVYPFWCAGGMEGMACCLTDNGVNKCARAAF